VLDLRRCDKVVLLSLSSLRRCSPI